MERQSVSSDIDEQLKNLEVQRKLALDEFVFRASVPLFRRINGDKADHLGTGTFVHVKGRLILLTARHNLDACRADEIAITRRPEGSELLTIGSFTTYKPIDTPGTTIDIVGIGLDDAGTRRHVENGWRVIEPSTGAQFVPGEALLVGYPSESLRTDGMNFWGRPTGIWTAGPTPVPQAAKEPIDPVLDLFLAHSARAIGPSGDEERMPRVDGMSGCAVWQSIETPESEVWSPDRAYRLVGIQSAATHGVALRVKTWPYIDALFRQV